MRPFSFDKSVLPLLLILALGVGLVVFLSIRLSTDPVQAAVKGDRILNILVVIEDGGEPVATEFFFYYPTTGRGAVLDIPADTGLIIKNLNKVASIDSVYAKGHPQAYAREIGGLLSTEVPLWIVMDADALARTADLLEGVPMFLPTPVDQKGPPRVLLPEGARSLDGDKLLQYVRWKPADEDDASAAARRQRLFQDLFRRIAEKGGWLTRQDVFPAWKGAIATNMGSEGLRRFVREIGRIDIDHLVLQRVTGTRRMVDKKALLFPHYDGELVRDIVRQTLNALAVTDEARSGSTYTLEILNATPVKGLATRTAEIFQSFGYDVVSVGNAEDAELEKTKIVYRQAGDQAVKEIAAVIQCGNVVADTEPDSAAKADFTIVLGSDFNGRYVRGK